MTHQFSAMTRLACAAWLAANLLAGTSWAQFGGDGGEFRGGFCGTARFGGLQAERLFAPDANLPAQGPGQLVIRDGRDGAWQRLPIARYHVNVVLHAPVALVQIDQTFYNPYFTQPEGVFLFHLPPDASLSRFAMYATPTELIEGELVDRGRVPDVCDPFAQSERDPIAAESVGANVFRIRVFPVPGRDVKRILIDYTVPLEPGPDGLCRFSLPLVNDLEPISDLRIGGCVFGPVPRESIASPSHGDLKVGDPIPASQADDGDGDGEPGKSAKPREPFGGSCIPFEVARRDCQSREPFSLEFRHAPEGPVAVQCYRAKGLVEDWRRNLRPTDPESRGPLTYFRLEVRDGLPDLPSREPLDLLILADTSAHARGRPEVGQAVRRLIGHVRPEDWVRLVCVDAAARPMHEGWAVAGSDELKQAVGRLENEFCLGGVDLARSVREAIQSAGPAEAGRRRMAVYVGTGEYGWGSGPEAEAVEPLAQLLGDAGVPLMSFYVPAASPSAPPRGRRLLEALSLAVGGLLWDAREPPLMRAHQAWLERGMPTPVRITDVRVSQAEPNDLIFPPAWTPGEPFVILGRVPTELANDGLDLRVAAVVNGKVVQWHHHLAIDAEPDNLLIGRLWAQHKLSELAVTGPTSSEEHHRAVALSREWGVLTPRTAFLLLEDSRTSSRYGIDASPRRYWDPLDRAQVEPLSPEWLSRVSVARGMAGEWRGPRESEDPLRRTLASQLERRDAMDRLAWQRGLFVPSAVATRPANGFPTLLFQAAAQPGKDYGRLFPHYRELSKRVSIETRFVTVQDIADYLGTQTGLRVEVDHTSLADMGLRADKAHGDARGPVGRGTLSLFSFARHALAQFGLTLIDEPSRLAITTPDTAANRLSVHVYPVADLILSDRATSRDLLVAPLLDEELAAEARIRKNLRRLVSLDAQDVPLDDILLALAAKADIPLIVDERSFHDVGQDRATPVTIRCENWPAEEALTHILQQFGGSSTIHGEAMLVTTPETMEDIVKVRLHSVRGIAPAATYDDMAEAMLRYCRLEPLSSIWLGGGFGGGGFGGGSSSISSGGDSIKREGAVAGLATDAAAVEGHSGHDEPDASRGAPQDVHQPGDRLLPPGTATQRWPLGGVFCAERQQASLNEVDFDSLIEMITSVVSPYAWGEGGGPPNGPVPFPWTLDLVVEQMPHVHEQIADLFAQLRAVPPAEASQASYLPARLPRVTSLRWGETEYFADTLRACVRPRTWDFFGGPGSIVPDEHRGALVVSQTQEVHRELFHLLTQLRRSRYEQLWGDRPWLTEVGPHRPMIDPWNLGAMAEETRADKLPRPRPGERAALAWRRMPKRGQWVWRRVTPAGEMVETITLVQDGPRLEVVLPECSIRIEGDMAAVAWPEFRLVEIGPWAEAVRHVLDSRLPWLPHRSNANLARWYDVLPAADEDGPADEEGPAAGEKVETAGEKAQAADEKALAANEEAPAAGEKAAAPAVRLVPPGFGPKGGTWLLVEPSDVEHLPGRVASFVGAEPTGRVRWAGETFEGSAIVWENAASEPLARWELVDYAVEPAPLPPLAEPHDGFVILDRRGESAEDTLLADALAALGQRDWAAAESQLAKAAQHHPGHPLVAMLRAWCHGQACDLARHDLSDEQLPDERLAELRAAVAAGHGFVFHWIVEGEPAWLSAEARYELLRGHPKMPRDGSNVLALARLAMQTGHYDEGLELLDRAMEAGLTAGDREMAFQHRRLHVELLLKRDRIPEAEAAAEQWSQRDDAAPDEIAALAECLLAYNRHEVAARLFTQAATTDGPAMDRARLLSRLADLHEGLKRWELLVEAADLVPEGSFVFQQLVATLFDELAAPIHAEIPAQLAQKASNKRLRAGLRIRHADLLSDASAAGDIFWELAEEGQLPPERLPEIMALWNRAKQPERTIAVCERELRRGRPLGDHLPAVLHDAYQAVNRSIDAHRAATEP